MSEAVFATAANVTAPEPTEAQVSTTPTEPVSTEVQSSAPLTQEFSYETLLSMIPESVRNEKVFQNINKEKPVEDLALQFLHAQKLVGVDKIEAPKPDWTPEKWDALYERIGRPKTPDDYKLPDFGELPIDKSALDEFRQIAHKTGMTSQQVENVMGMYKSMVEKQVSSVNETSQAQMKEKMLKFQESLGEKFSDTLSQAEFGFTKFADPDLQELIKSNPALQNEPALIRHFQKLAVMAREDAARSGDSTNPLNINSKEEALSVLQRFEDENSSILFRPAEGMTIHDREQRAKLLRRREELYKIAYGE